jgi:PAS domain S-box-containing protein
MTLQLESSESRILLVEDSDRDAFVVERALRASGVILERVATLGAALVALRSSHFDLILTDLGLPDSAGAGTVESIVDQAGITPVVVLTGHEDDRVARGAFEAGAQDYLVKGSADAMSRLRGAVEYALRRVRERADQDRDEISKANRRFRSLIDCSEATLVIDEKGRRVYASASATGMTGYKPAEMVGRAVHSFAPGLSLAGAAAREGHTPLLRRDGKSIGVDYAVTPVKTRSGAVDSVVVTLRDRGTQRELERDVEQVIRLAILGQSTASAVHELNTLMAIAVQHAEIVSSNVAGDTALKNSIALVTDAIRRGRRVSTEILRFTRPPEHNVERIDVRRWIQHVADEVAALVDGRKLIVEQPAPLYLSGDTDQLAQVIFNLATNARDATPPNGTITIGAARGDAIPFVNNRMAEAHRFAVIYVCDTGTGIAPEAADRLFEPLFSTKAEGTGFGLATSLRIVLRHGGQILHENRPGAGAAFYVVLPLVPATVGSARAASSS